MPRALERVGGLQAQYAPAMYVGLWSRVAGFRREDLTRALERRTAVQGTLLRATIHLVSARDYWPFAVAIREARREWWVRVDRSASAAELAGAARTLRAALGGGSLSAKEVEAVVGRPRAGGVAMWLDLVRVPPSGTWERRRADLYAAAEDWLRGSPEIDPDGAVEHVVRRYLGGFGPAAAGEIANWAGLPVRTITAALSRMSLRRFDGGLVDLPRAPLPDPDTPAPVRFLPQWDATLLVHARRAGILPEEYRPLVFSTKNPQSVGTVLVDGSVAASWSYRDGAVRVEPFRRLDAGFSHAVREEADRLTAFYSP